MRLFLEEFAAEKLGSTLDVGEDLLLLFGGRTVGSVSWELER
jgi:hypothetical protein